MNDCNNMLFYAKNEQYLLSLKMTSMTHIACVQKNGDVRKPAMTNTFAYRCLLSRFITNLRFLKIAGKQFSSN